jgi:uncharacterized damage-inducible protein DinB
MFSIMPTSDVLEIMLAHDRWATRALIDACAALTPEQLRHRFEMGPGSLHDTAAHIVGSMRRWGDVLAGRAERPRLEASAPAPADLRALHDEIATDLHASARAHPPHELVTASRAGRSFTFTRGAILAHVLTHGMHHRAQCLNMLRRLGVEPLPPSSVIEWVMTADARPQR